MYLSKLKNIFFNFNQGGQEPSFNKLPKIAQKRKQIEKLLNKNSTPLFIADKDILLERLEELEKALKKHWKNYQIAYSFKTNYELAKSKMFKKRKLWAEVVSDKEYKMAKNFGFNGKQIIFNGPYKTNNALLQALKDRALIFVDNFNELDRLLKISRSLKKNYQIGLRLNTKIPHLGESRFGFSIDRGEARQAVKKIMASKNIKLTGFHMHIGTDVDNPLCYREAARSLKKFIKSNISNLTDIKYLDFGGGFPASGLQPLHRKKWNPFPIEDYIKVITKELIQLFPNQKPLLILEPGRYLVDDATIFITKVINSKHLKEKQVLTTDAAITMLPLVYYRPQIVKMFNKNLKEKRKATTNSVVYGATCKEDDLLYKNRLPQADLGDYIVYYVAGAYNLNMGSDFIFNIPKLFLV